MGTAANVKLGVCSVSFGGVDLGYTKGGVKVSYSAESMEKTVDQEDAPIGEIITKQNFEVKVPLAEYDLDKFVSLLPNATLYTDGTKKKLKLSGVAGTDLLSFVDDLVLTPMGADANEKLTLLYAAPKTQMDFAYEKENVRVFEVTFRALKGALGWVQFGDPSAVGVDTLTPSTGSTSGGTAVVIKGTGFTGATGVDFGTSAGTAFSVVDDNTINVTTPSGTAGAVTIHIKGVGTGSEFDKTNAFTYAA